MKETKKKPTRRLFLEVLGKVSVVVALFAQIYGAIKAFIPTVLYEPPSKFKIGKPGDFSVGITFLPEWTMYVFRKGDDFRAISAVCPHLNCVADWKPDQKRFFCSCHGSVFSKDGTNLEGPAPRPLSWHPLSLSFDSHLVVETDKQVSGDYRLSL